MQSKRAWKSRTCCLIGVRLLPRFPLSVRFVMRRTHYVALAALLIASGCGDLKDIMAVSTAVQEHYHMPASINLNNGSHMAITFQNASIESLKLDSAGLDGFARGGIRHGIQYWAAHRDTHRSTVPISSQ